MKTSEMNSRQKKAFLNIYHAANFHIGGLENGMLDNAEGTAEHEQYKQELYDHEQLANIIYQLATTELYGDGSCSFGKRAESFLKDIRFCGKAWLMERVEKRLVKMGY